MLQQQQLQFSCLCGFSDNLEQEDKIVAHIKNCQIFKSTSILEDVRNKSQPLVKMNRTDLLIMRADLKAYIDQVNEELFNQGYGQAYEGGYEPLKLKQKSSKQYSNDTQFLNYQDMRLRRSPVNCPCCNKSYDSDMDAQLLWYLEQCCHLICRSCLSKQVNQEYINKDGLIKCLDKNCPSFISTDDIIQIMGKDKYNDLDFKLILKSQNIVACIKCKAQFSFEKGNVNEIVKDQKGNKLVGEVLQNYIENRFTCPSHECKSEQCKTCGSIPYHIGFTCDQYKLVQKSRKCRFCDTSIANVDESKKRAIQEVCDQQECKQRAEQVCLKIHTCGHPCCGYRDEHECLPCLEENCAKNDDNLQQNADDYCNICFTEALKCSPCVRAKCGHVFHQECILKRLETRWNGPRIVFNFCLCPLCKVWVDFPPDNPTLSKNMKENSTLFEQIKVKVLERLTIEGRDKDKELIDPKHPFCGKPLEYGMAIFAYYECHKCKSPYFGGLKNCQLNIEDDRRQYDKTELICPKCCPVSFESDCKKHGKEYIEFKCRFCCSVALWFCWGTTHFCEPCHRKAQEMRDKKVAELTQCKTAESCPLRIQHKPNGEECALGCGLCRQEKIIADTQKK